MMTMWMTMRMIQVVNNDFADDNVDEVDQDKDDYDQNIKEDQGDEVVEYDYVTYPSFQALVCL